jgi:endoglycosylceramidase
MLLITQPCLFMCATLDAVRLQSRSGKPRAFVDAAGRERIFHGANVIVKGPPWVPDSRSFSHDVSMSQEDFAWMQRMGMTVMRLGVMWPGLEPTRGHYNETYLDELQRIASLAAAAGVYTLLDMHQDGLSEIFCGEGLPAWAVKPTTGGLLSRPFPAPFDKLDAEDYYIEQRLGGAPQLPTRAACASHKKGPGHMEFTEAAAVAYQGLYSNWDGVGDAWAAAWAHVAARFRGQPHILGLELLNEPFAGNPYGNPLLMVPYPNPWNADRVNLQPAYDRISAAVRTVDANVLLFFAGVTWGDAGAGFSAPPGGAQQANRSVLAYHYYSSVNRAARPQLEAQARAAERLDTAAFLTETSMPGTTGASHFSAVGALGDQADAQLQSWAGFEWKSFCRERPVPSNTSQFGVFGACKTGDGRESFTGDGGRAPTPSVQRDATRTYATATAGRIVSMFFNVSSDDFALVFDSIGLPASVSTEIFVWPARYAGGAAVTAVAANGAAMLVEYDGAGHTVKVRPESALPVGTRVVVTVAKKGSGVHAAL